jgi:alpha-L-fucosidase
MNIKIKNLVTLTFFLLAISACSHKVSQGGLQSVELVEPLQRTTWIAPELETSQQRDQRMAWWRAARFGLFIHWGVYSVPAGVYQDKPASAEWIMLRSQIPVDDYKAYAKDFNPEKYDAEKWVLAAKHAGMKYIVITAKHHDGFSLYDSKVTDWDVVDASPYGKDLLKPLAEAARKHGIKLGFYYSQAQDWVHAGGAKHKHVQWDAKQQGSFNQYINDIAAPQVKEILSNYGDIAVLWFDTPVGVRQAHVKQFYQHLALQPDIITNNRLGGGALGDTVTPEQFIPALGIPGHDWETCMTMNDSWGYRSNDHQWKSSKELIHKLGDIASKGGNFLLNVGPTSQGEIPEQSLTLLNDIGQWMKVNSEAIYGTEQSVFTFLDWGRVTQKILSNGNTRLYLHVWHWPQSGKLTLPLSNHVVDSFLLANQDKKKTIDITSSADGKTLFLPEQAPDKVSSVIVLDIVGKAKLTKNRFNQPLSNGQYVLDTKKAMLHNHLGSHMVFVDSDDRDEKAKISQWQTKPGRRAEAWIEWQVEFKQKGQYQLSSLLASESKNSQAIKVVTEYLGSDESQFKTLYNKRGRMITPKGQSLIVNTANISTKPYSVDFGVITISEPGIYRVALLPFESPVENRVNKQNNMSSAGMGLVAEGEGWLGPDVYQLNLKLLKAVKVAELVRQK